MEHFGEFLNHTQGPGDHIEKLQKQMKNIAKWSLMCGSELIEHRKNSWELYGFDFMVDDKCNAWLIEINSSPACDYSTKVTERYVQMALVEMLGIVLDMREYEKEKTKKRKKRRKKKHSNDIEDGIIDTIDAADDEDDEGGGSKAEEEKESLSHGPDFDSRNTEIIDIEEDEDAPDLGQWKRIHQGPYLENPVAAFGVEMALKGAGMKLPRKGPSLKRFGCSEHLYSSANKHPITSNERASISDNGSSNSNKKEDVRESRDRRAEARVERAHRRSGHTSRLVKASSGKGIGNVSSSLMSDSISVTSSTEIIDNDFADASVLHSPREPSDLKGSGNVSPRPAQRAVPRRLAELDINSNNNNS